MGRSSLQLLSSHKTGLNLQTVLAIQLKEFHTEAVGRRETLRTHTKAFVRNKESLYTTETYPGQDLNF